MRLKPIKDYIKNINNYETALSYEKHDVVESIYIENEEGYFEIEAVVNVLGRTFPCSFTLREYDGELVSYGCFCAWCTEMSPCAHIGVVLLELEKLFITEYPFQYINPKFVEAIEERQSVWDARREYRLKHYSSIGHELIENQKKLYKTQITQLIQDEHYEISPSLVVEYHDQLTVQFKVGLNKKYVVKNVSRFLEHLDNQEMVRYGKELEFVHHLEAFDEFAIKQIEFMKKASIDYLKENTYYRNFELGRSIPLTNKTLDLFFDTYVDNHHLTFKVKENPIKIPFKITKETEYYVLTMELEKEIKVGDKYIYHIKLNNKGYVIERIGGDPQGILVALIERLSHYEVVISKEEYPDFSKYVLAPIKDYVEVEEPEDMVINTYDKIYLYGDINEENNVVFRLEYMDENGRRQKGFDPSFNTNYQQDLVETYIKNLAHEIDEHQHCAYFLDNNEKTFKFIREGLVFLKDYCEIYVSESLKNLGEVMHYSVTVGVKIESNLLALDIRSTEIPRGEMAHVLDHYRRKKKFYRLKNGELLSLDSPELEELDQFMQQYHIDTRDIKNGKTNLNAYRMFSIDDDASQMKHIQIDRATTFKKAMDKFENNQAKPLQLKEQYESILRDYQKVGIQWLDTLRGYGFNGILADDMGLGKTLQVIALLESVHSKKTSIVVCPSSLIYNWEDEVHKFSDTLKVGCVVGMAKHRNEIISSLQDYDLIITSYDYMRRDFDLYKEYTFHYVILDEAQYIKNQHTKNAQSVKKLNAQHKLALTGTPIENSLAELWSIFDFLMPDYLFNYHYFLKQYENDIVKDNDQEKVAQLRKLVSPFILRRNKKDVLTELPDKIETIQSVHFTEEENKLYLANLALVNSQLQDVLNMEHVNKVQVLAMLTRLRQICCEPRLVYDNIEIPSSKLEACIELIKSLNANNQKALLFSSFTSMLDLIAKELSSLGISFYMLTGSTSKEERRELVSKFQEDATAIFLISLKAGGTGLNLTAAQAVIHFDPWWNVSAQNQATDRVHRFGQENKVQVFKLVMKNSIEEKILTLQEKKKELADAFVENNEGSLSKMNKEDIMALFS